MTPPFRNASSRRRWASVSKLNSVVSKICESGLNVTLVPRFFVVPVVGLPLGGALGVYIGERLRLDDGAAAWATTKATLKGFGVATLVQFAAALAMTFTWVAWVVID